MAIKIAAHFIQFGLLVAVLLVGWPSWVQSVVDYFDVISFDLAIFHPQCSFTFNAYHKLITALLLPVLLVALLLLVERCADCSQAALYNQVIDEKLRQRREELRM